MTSNKIPMSNDSFDYAEEDDVHEDSIPATSSVACKSVPWIIFDSYCCEAQQVTEFNAVTISLDAQLKSDLNWKKAVLHAKEAIDKNYKIFWDLNLGLFEAINSPLSNQQQFLTLKLAINHFNNTVWNEFS